MTPPRTTTTIEFAIGGARQADQVLCALRALQAGAGTCHPLSVRDCYWMLAGIADRAQGLGLCRIRLLSETIAQILGERRFEGMVLNRLQCGILLVAVRRLAALMEFHAAGFQDVGSDQAIIRELSQWIEGACAAEAGMGSGAHRVVLRDRRSARRRRWGGDEPSDPGREAGGSCRQSRNALPSQASGGSPAASR
jgi:hypothetical protein